MTDVITPKLAVPFRITAESCAAVVEQDSVEEIAQCVGAIVRTPIGSRLEDPELGISDPTFTSGELADLADQINEWEPRATEEITEDAIDETLTKRVRVGVGQIGDTTNG